MPARRARIYDLIAICIAAIAIILDQWTKALVIDHLSPAGSHAPISVFGNYLTIDYIQNNGAAFSIFRTSPLLLSLMIALAVLVLLYFYLRMLNTGQLFYKMIFGLIVGGALGNLLDRARHGGYVTDFVHFMLPQIHFDFAIFNVADACISVGVVLLFVALLFFGWHSEEQKKDQSQTTAEQTSSEGSALQAKE